MLQDSIFVRPTESSISPTAIEIAWLSCMVELISSINPLVSATKMPPLTAKFYEIWQFEQDTWELSFTQKIPPSEAAFFLKVELKISVLVRL